MHQDRFSPVRKRLNDGQVENLSYKNLRVDSARYRAGTHASSDVNRAKTELSAVAYVLRCLTRGKKLHFCTWEVNHERSKCIVSDRFFRQQ